MGMSGRDGERVDYPISLDAKRFLGIVSYITTFAAGVSLYMGAERLSQGDLEGGFCVGCSAALGLTSYIMYKKRSEL